MDLEGELDAAPVEFVQDGRPELMDLGEARLDHLLRRRREGVDVFPDGRAHEAVDDGAAHGLGRPGRGLHFLDGPGPDLRWPALDLGRRERVEPLVVVVADALAGEVGAEGPAVEVVFLEDPLLLPDVGGVRSRPSGRPCGRPSRRSPGRRSPRRSPSCRSPRTAGRPIVP